jgi:hypothetical protein
MYKNIESTLEGASLYSLFSWNCMSELTKLLEVASEIPERSWLIDLIFGV